jgi:DNA-binding transcriptional LysR family regulator
MLVDMALSQSEQSLDWTYQARHSSTLLSLAESGVGVAILPLSSIPNREPALVVARPLILPQVERLIGTVRRTGHTLTSSAESLHHLLLNNI